MKKMKRFSKYFFLVALGLLVLAGGSLGFAAPTEINFYMWEDPTYQAIVDAFNSSQKEVYVKTNLVPTSVYETKIMTLLAGGADIDCYMQKRQVDMFMQYKNGFIEPLNKYLKNSNYNLKSIEPYKAQVTIKGKLVAIPFRGAGYYTYYNKKLFEKAGIPTPNQYVKEGAWNWKKFAEVTKKLSSGDGKQYGALLFTWPQFSLFPVIQENTYFISAEGKVKFDEKAMTRSIKMRRDLERNKAIMSMAQMKATNTQYAKAFYDGNIGMIIMGEWFPGMMLGGRDNNLLRNFTWDDWGITRMPCDSSKYINVGASTFNHVYSRSKKKEAAFKFISWMGSVEGSKIVARNGFLPPVNNEETKKELAKVIPDSESLNYFLESAPRVPLWYTQYGSQVSATLNSQLERYLASDMTEQVFIKEVKERFNQIVESNR